MSPSLLTGRAYTRGGAGSPGWSEEHERVGESCILYMCKFGMCFAMLTAFSITCSCRVKRGPSGGVDLVLNSTASSRNQTCRACCTIAPKLFGIEKMTNQLGWTYPWAWPGSSFQRCFHWLGSTFRGSYPSDDKYESMRDACPPILRDVMTRLLHQE